MKRLLPALLVIAVCILPWVMLRPTDSTPTTLTRNDAKKALLDLMARREDGVMSRSWVESLIEEPVIVNGSELIWGSFRLDLVNRRYTLHFSNGASGKSHFASAYEGDFEWRNGRWIATPPRVIWQT